jgi:hypothetical protein
MKIFIIFMIFLPVLLYGESLTQTYYFDVPVFRNEGIYQTIEFNDTHLFGAEGEPFLPYYGAKVLLPQGESIKEIFIERTSPIEIEREIYLYPTQPQYPFSDTRNHPFTQPDEEIYEQNISYPTNPVFHYTTQYLSGFSIGFISFTPVEYYPQERKIKYYQSVSITIVTEPSQNAQDAVRFLHNSLSIVNYVSKLVSNPETISRYQLPAIRNNGVDFIILAAQTKIPLLQPYAEIYRNRGYNVSFESVETIAATQNGIDLQMKIRNYFIQQYQIYPLSFALLVGDVNIIPHRGMYVNMGGGDYTDTNIPADMYYCSLDGTWDNNGNGYWGEPSEADLAPEFAIGRLTYNNDQDIVNAINKTNYYLNNPASDNLTSSLFIGEYLWEGPTWGGDYMDEMIGGSSMHGHTTVGVPTNWNISTLYERDGNWGASQLFPLLSSGPNLINHLGHANVDYVLKLYSYQVNNSNITNNGVNQNFSSVLYTQGCYAGSFDNRTTSGSYVDDCIAEKFISIANGTASIVANSRYGWGMQGSTNGASQFFHREFIDAIFGQHIFTVGQALTDSKIASIPFISQPVMYWCTYETNILGDPALEIWTATPQQMIVSHPSEMVVGLNEIPFSSNVANAKILIKRDSAVIASGFTGEDGSAVISLWEPIGEVATLSVNLLKHNFFPYSGTIQIIPGDGPYIIANNPQFTESGNYIDGIIQSLDRIVIHLDFLNIGSENTPDQIEANLLTNSDFVSIIEGNQLFSPMTPNTLVQGEFEIEILPGIDDQQIVLFQVQIQSGNLTWQSVFSLLVNNSKLQYNNYIMNVLTGGTLSPGDEAEMYLTFANIGNGISYDLDVLLLSFDPYVSVSGSAGIDVILAGTEAIINQPFTLHVSPDSPNDRLLDFALIAVDLNGSFIESNFSVYVGEISYPFENGMGEWTTQAISAGFGNEWHLSDFRNNTANGNFSMKCGGSAGSNYANLLHAGLVTPPIPLSANSYLTFYHWMNAEVQSATQAWDGGILEISQNGGAFQSIMPVGGYPYTVVDNQASPFPPGTPLFSGTHGWQQVEVDLSAFSGTVQIRFTFGSDGYVSYEGWYIDDVALYNYTNSDFVQVIPLTTVLHQNYPNPFNPETNIRFAIPQSQKVELTIYNIKGQEVKKLLHEQLPAGNHTVVWNGKDNQNQQTASGMYFYRLKSGNYLQTKKMMLLK